MRWAVSLVLVLVGVGVGLLYVSMARTRAMDAACRGENTQGAPAHASYGATRAAVIGDSWASGYGLDDPTESFAYHLARLEKWDVTVSAVSGTGFATDSGCPNDYASRVDLVPRDAEIVVLEGGLNDVGAVEDVRPNAVTTLTAVRRRAPDATVVVVGPPLMPFRDEQDLRRIDEELAQAADMAGVHYISTLDWMVETEDELHPTGAAHRAFAQRLRDALRRL